MEPSRAVPLGDVVEPLAADVGKNAPEIQRRTTPVVEHCERIHRTAQSSAERGPSGAGPLGNAVNRLSAGRGEESPGTQSWAAPVIEDRQRQHVATGIAPWYAQSAAERGPLRAVPLGNVVNHHAARGSKGPPSIQSRTGPIVEDCQRRHRLARSAAAAERGPLQAVPARDVVGHYRAGRGESAPDV